MPRHILRLMLLIGAFIIVAYAAIRFFTVSSFYEYGHYRGDSVAEIAADKPKYKGTGYCESCHAEQFAAWSTSVHNSVDRAKSVKCETCHGAAGGRDAQGMFQHVATGADHPDNLKLSVPTDTRKLCTLCHERMAGRPAQQPQIVVAEHAGTQQCTVCHNAHSPKIGLAVAAATTAGDPTVGKEKAVACAGCHGADGISEELPGPSLAGQNAPYFMEALKAYITGARDNPMMGAAAKAISTEDFAGLAAYFAGLKCDSTLTEERQAASPDRTAASKCVACHGASGVSVNRQWPNLVGLSKNYLNDAVKAYRSGARKNSMMGGIANGLSDADIESTAAYYVTASCR